MERNSDLFSAKKIAVVGVFAALAYGVSILSFPIFPVTPYLRLDFSFAIMLLAGYALGPLSAAFIVIIVNLLGAIGSSGGITGAIANTFTAGVFVVLPSLIYKYKKGLKWVIPVLLGCVILQGLISLPMNRYVTFYIFQISDPAGVFAEVWGFILAFNLIKGGLNAMITLILYKRLKILLNKFM